MGRRRGVQVIAGAQLSHRFENGRNSSGLEGRGGGQTLMHFNLAIKVELLVAQ